jgi:hypothetical protein
MRTTPSSQLRGVSSVGSFRQPASIESRLLVHEVEMEIPVQVVLVRE